MNRRNFLTTLVGAIGALLGRAPKPQLGYPLNQINPEWVAAEYEEMMIMDQSAFRALLVAAQYECRARPFTVTELGGDQDAIEEGHIQEGGQLEHPRDAQSGLPTETGCRGGAQPAAEIQT